MNYFACWFRIALHMPATLQIQIFPALRRHAATKHAAYDLRAMIAPIASMQNVATVAALHKQMKAMQVLRS
jgi:hypothetical protein